MSFNLDIEISRAGTNSVKWEHAFNEDHMLVPSDVADKKHGADRLLPMWVADMDFHVPQESVDAIIKRAKHGLFGYSAVSEGYFEAFAGFVARRHDWVIEPDWVVLTPGVVPAFNMLLQTFTLPGDKVIIQRPVYHPFTYAVENNGRTLVNNALINDNGYYRMDFDDLAEKAADPDTKLMIFCSPHNPVGRVWTREELTRMGEICLANNVLVISDEIHCDLAQRSNKFVSFGSISEAFAQNSICCMAPSKTFNMAGMKVSNIIIPNEEMKLQFDDFLMCLGLKGTNCFGVIAAEQAYRHGDAWLDAVIDYVGENHRYMCDYLAQHLPQLRLSPLEGTYLTWLDCRALELNNEELESLVYDKAGLFVNQGHVFGEEAGSGFLRFNLACPRSIVEEAMSRLKTAVSTLEYA